MSVTFKAGQVQTFIATRSFALGQSGVTVPEGAEVQYDGTSVSYEGLAPQIMPQLRGAIRAGWIVPAAEYDSDAPAQPPKPAGMQMRAADGGNPMDPNPRRSINNTTIDAEEREVGNVREMADSTAERNKGNYRRQRTSRDESTAGRLSSSVNVESQEGTVVAGIKFQTLAGEESKKAVVNLNRAGEAIRQAKNVKARPGKGRTREELLRDAVEREGLTEEEIQEYREELAAHRSAHGVEEPVVVGRVAAPGVKHTEGFNVTGSVGGGVDIADMGGTGGVGRTHVVESEGIKFTVTAPPGANKGYKLVDKVAPVAGPPADDAMCRRIAKCICSDFPENYVFSDPIRKKIARLQADFEDRPDVIRAVAAAETDGEVKRRLVEEFPDAFGG
jgi:hypothetical protein